MNDTKEYAYTCACEDFLTLSKKLITLDEIVDKYVETDNSLNRKRVEEDEYSYFYSYKMRELIRSLLVDSLVGESGYKIQRVGDLLMWV